VETASGGLSQSHFAKWRWRQNGVKSPAPLRRFGSTQLSTINLTSGEEPGASRAVFPIHVAARLIQSWWKIQEDHPSLPFATDCAFEDWGFSWIFRTFRGMESCLLSNTTNTTMWFQSLEVKLMPGDTGSCSISSLKRSRWWSMFAVYGGNRFVNPSIRRNWLPRIQKIQDWLCVSPVLLRKGGSFPPWTEVTHHWTLVKLQPNYVWDLSSALILSHLTLVTLLKTWPEHSEELQSPHRTDLRKRNKYDQIWRDMIPWIIFNLHF
jgi:hypothetical protein